MHIFITELTWLTFNLQFFRDIGTPGVEGQVGHFTQMISAHVYLLGCAAARWSEGITTYIMYACMYGPSGNVIGAPLYRWGKPCSACPGGGNCSTKYEGLCS